MQKKKECIEKLIKLKDYMFTYNDVFKPEFNDIWKNLTDLEENLRKTRDEDKDE